MTQKDADEILQYVAQDILAPMAFDKRPASDVWNELIGEPFTKLCKIVYEKISENP